MSLIDASLRDLLEAFSSSRPTPGGGSASALAAAVGASLLSMVAKLPKTRNGSSEDRSALGAAAVALEGIRRDAADAIDADSAAYDEVVAAYKLSKATPAEQQARTAAIQRALRGATEVPLRVMRVSRNGCEQARTIAAHGHRAASSDVGVAVALLRAALKGAQMNVDVNVGSVTDAPYAEAARVEAITLTGEGDGFATDAEALLRNG